MVLILFDGVDKSLFAKVYCRLRVAPDAWISQHCKKDLLMAFLQSVMIEA